MKKISPLLLIIFLSNKHKEDYNEYFNFEKHWQKMICIFAVLFAFAVAILGPTVLTADAAEIAGTPITRKGNMMYLCLMLW